MRNLLLVRVLIKPLFTIFHIFSLDLGGYQLEQTLQRVQLLVIQLCLSALVSWGCLFLNFLPR